MNPTVHAAMTAHHGLVTRSTMRDLGIHDNQIGRMCADGAITWLRRGVYVDTEVWRAADPFRGQPLLRARAAVLAMRRGWVFSHDSAAHLLGMEIVSADPPYAHITRPGVTSAWSRNGVKHHLARFAQRQLVDVDGVETLDLARTAVDIARERDERHGLAACDSALRMGVPRSGLWDAVAPMVSWPNVIRTRWCIENADARAATVIESLGREFVLALGIGEPDPQFPVQLDRTVYWADLRVGCHLFEMHGGLKYRPQDQGGVAEKPAAKVLLDERKRERLLVAERLGVTNLYWEDFFDGRAAARRRALAEVATTRERFGAELPERLARNAARIREERSGPDRSN